ncbi:putative mitochondrial genome maintenance protein mgm101 protein [Rosellinia necatrix]|uniref:Mitochondrial genome maintenance protein MGM101 n=1 Tax=Rosellinia necatrix TaxID=77044 RepID=A0A1W2TFK1_ROSNE|nr:putative mitochondrial genome maintenance protein mgm101 protein [Rosellinia necatrix]
MTSRAMSPMQAAGRRMRLVPRAPTMAAQCTARRWVATSKPKPYAMSSTPPPPRSTTTTTTAARPAAAAARTPIPAVSGEPLPDAPPATLSPAAASSNSSSSSSSSSSSMGYEDAAATLSSENGAGSGGGAPIDWTRSYHGLGTLAFPPEAAAILQARLDPDDIEVKPDGIIYLPEIKYRRILNTAFGPGGWGLAPRGQLMVQDRMVTREYALVVHGRFVAQARGEQQYFSEDGVSTAAEGCKSNALMRCCKDLGIASELWDPRYIRKFMKEHATQVWVEHVTTKKKKQIWLRKDDEVRYPFKKS